MRGLVFIALLFAGCSGSNGAAPPPPAADGPSQAAALLVTSGLETLDASNATPADQARADLIRLGLPGADAVYELSTPAGEDFRFDLATRADGDGVRLSFAHGSDGGFVPRGDADSLGNAGLVPVGNGLEARDEWIDVVGQGQARTTIQGSIERDQTLVVECENSSGRSITLVDIRIGDRSPINDSVDEAPDLDPYDGVLLRRAIHSSDRHRYGMPAAAQSGDRTSILVYEGSGDRVTIEKPEGLPFEFDFEFSVPGLHERRFQYDREADEVTGAEPVVVGAANGFTRDHELAALRNVLAIVRATAAGPKVELSFDRGRTFGQSRTLDVGDEAIALPIVQIDIAPDYALAVTFWRTNRDGSSDLILVEALPNKRDANDSPIGYRFDEATVLRHADSWVIPTLMGVRGTSNGDLVVGYGFTEFDFDPEEWTFSATTQYRCSTRIGADGEFRDVLVEEDEIASFDPSVALVGSGEDLGIFYAYEARDGVRLRTSRDGGETFGEAIEVESRGAHMPSVFVREQEGVRVDLLYLAPSRRGLELRLRHWDDFGKSDAVDATIVAATVEEESDEGDDTSSSLASFRDFVSLTQVGSHGYDGTLDGDDLVVVVHKVTIRASDIFDPLPPDDGGNGGPIIRLAGTDAPLADGLDGDVADPNPDHRHQLCLVILD